MDNLAEFQSLRRTMERCSEIVSDSYSLKPEEMLQFEGELPPNHNTGHRRQRYWVTEVDGDLVVALPGTTHPLDWSSNMRVHYTPIDGSHPPASTPTEQLEQQPCAHAGFYFRAETIPTLALLEQAAAKGMRLVLTGHSLGAAVANVCTLTALSAQKKAREAAANAAIARRTAAQAPQAGDSPPGSPRSQRQRHQQKQKQRLVSPWQAAASAAAVAAAEAHTNHSWCSANSDILVSPQAALVEVLCVAFASPHWANQGLADYIEDNGWGEAFVNVVVPEDYCLKLFNNVLTSANIAERHTLSRCNSKCSLHDSSSATRLADEAEEEGACCPPDTLQDYAAVGAAAAACMPGPAGPSAADKQALLYGVHSNSNSSSSISTSAGTGCSAPAPRYSYQPGAQQQLPSALAGTRRKQKKQQLSFALPDQDTPMAAAAAAAAGTVALAAAGAAAVVAPAAAGGCPLLDAARPPPVAVPALFAADAGSWNGVSSSPPSSPSCASLSSLSSLNSTRSWTLMAYLPDVLMRTFSSSTGSSGALDDAGSSRASSDGGCPDAAADAIAAMFAGPQVAPAQQRPPAAAEQPAASLAAAGGSSDAQGACSSSSSGGWGGLRHAKSAVDLSVCSLSDSSSLGDSSSSSSSLDDCAVLPGTTSSVPAATAAGLGLDLPLPLPQQHQHQQRVSLLGGVRTGSKAKTPLRRSVTSASLSALSAPGPNKLQLLDPLKLSSSLASVGSLLPSLRSVLRASRAALNKASCLKEAVLDVPLTVFEAGLIKALKPPMYKPVGQQWILSATGLVPQQQPIFMYPKHVHDVYWHKELALVAFREHSIVFYKKRLLQQASRR